METQRERTINCHEKYIRILLRFLISILKLFQDLLLRIELQYSQHNFFVSVQLTGKKEETSNENFREMEADNSSKWLSMNINIT